MSLRVKELEEQDANVLINRKEELYGILTAGKGTSIDSELNELCEIERELTLREE